MTRGSIRKKVLRVIATAAVAAVALTGSAILVYDVVAFRSAVVREHTTLARMVAFHSAASLAFDDPDYARSILGGLAVEEHVVEAVLERADGRELARYRPKGGAPDSPSPPGDARPRLAAGHRVEGSFLFLVHPVVRDGERLGTLRLVASLSEIAARRKSQLVVIFCVLLASGLLVFPLSSRLSRVLADPILGLAEAADRIGKGDLSTRVEASYDDELGTLATAFNEMTEKLSVTTVSKDYLDDILSSMNDALIVVDEAGRIESINRAGVELLGYGEAELEDQPLSTLLGERTDVLREARLHGTVEDSECLLRTRDDRPIPASLSVAWMGKDADRAAVLVARDIRDRKEAETSLLRSEARFRCLVEQAADALIVFDSEGMITEVNHQTCQALGFSREELLGQSLARFVVGLDLENRKVAWRRLTPGAATTSERMLRRKDGAEIAVEVRLAAIDLGGERSYFALARDITARKEQERALIEAREAALEASRLKSQFLANVSHEMRTPMNGIIGMTEIALETDLSPDQRGYLETVRSSADSLLRIIDDLLDLTGIEAGRLQLEAVSFSPSAVVSEATSSLAFEAHRKGLEMIVDVAPELPRLAVGDPYRLRQVLTNLLSNAIKFTDSGEVALRVRAAGAGASRARFLFVVEDTGIGVPPEKRDDIFDVFAQADGSTTRRFGGAGLGLAISSRLVAAMGGRLGFTSEPGGGSTFHFEVPLPLAAGEEPRDEMPMELHGLSALVVDDNASSRELLGRLLARWGAVARGVGSASEARDLASGATDELRFDVAFVDEELAGSEGGELAEGLAANGVRAVLLTSPGGQRAPSGFEPSLSKPIDPDRLLAALRRLLSPEGQAQKSAASSAAESESVEKLRILLAEDNPVNCAVVEKTLSRRGHRVVTVLNGRLAVERAREEKYDLVLMDIQMPEMDGIQATEAIREWESASGAHRTPIVALTAHAMKGDRERCLRAGMDDYVSKPVKPAVLVEVVERATSRGEGHGSEPVAERPDAVLELEALLDRIGQDRSLLSEIVGLYYEEAPGLVEKVRDGLAGNAPGEPRRAAHRLRGMLATMGANQAARVAEDLEIELDAENLSGAMTLVESLAEALRDLERALAELDPARGASRGEVTV